MRGGLHLGVLDRFGQEIAGGRRPAGTVLTLAGLEAELGVSRTVVREVVRVLEAVGMVEARQRVGVRVLPEDRWNALDPQVIQWRLAGPGRHRQLVALTELRMAVEPTAARLAARHASTADRARLAELAAGLRLMGEEGEGRSEAYLAADVAFHVLLLQAGGNEMLAALTGPVAEVLAGRATLGLMPALPVADALDHHEATAAAVLAGDEDAAERHARAVVQEVWDAVVAAGGGQRPPRP
ncbi:FadR/GntR family transcriptional regulator [Cellulomonas marina]|uniref:DNA-binding transcriptional regulator, FadR family n=1 Tax=Cellulomonas marina TaxID=988821 RepID=A0A1I0Z140_9CELL|nr:FCD domain-containing protein [Cellulomonas marina]GIG28170.1 GntR family transcriptional regulator [Cellulomonas marina]SFB19345.1 DNA-binding transcriptional regulator, FadR family [Cellulomonas marina]